MAKILVVDDSEIMRRSLIGIIKQIGHEVIGVAKNGAEACEAYVKYKPDLVTMDITMPVMNGVEAVKKIMGSFPDARIIIISAESQNRLVLEAIKSGARNYLLKPIHHEKMSQAIDDSMTEQRKETHSTAGDVPAAGIGTSKEESGQKVTTSGDAAGAGENRKSESFGIQVTADSFNINIYGSFDDSALQDFQTAINGLLYVSPLNVVLNFFDREKININILNSLSECINQIKETGGTVKLISKELKPESGLKHQTV